MPYPNQHSARVREPGDFSPNSFRTKDLAPGVSVILGKLKGGDGAMTAQAYRFDRGKFTAAEARKWLSDHGVKHRSFEAATGTAREASEGDKDVRWFRESVYSSPVRVDAEAGVIYGVRILGGESRNHRRYVPAAMREAVSLYEGHGVNVGHGRDGRGLPPGSDLGALNRFGWLEKVHEEGGNLTGDLHLLKAHSFSAPLLEAAQRRPELFGLSHEAEGDGRYDGPTFVVTKINRVRSVDVVGDPATANSLFESDQGDSPVQKKLLEVIAAIPSTEPGVDALKALITRAPAGVVESLVFEASEGDGPQRLAALATIRLVESMAESNWPAPAAADKADNVKDLAAKVDRLEAELSARRFLEAAGIPSDDNKIGMLLALREEKYRKSLLESWKVEVARRKPDSWPLYGSRQPGADEKFPATGKELAAYLNS